MTSHEGTVEAYKRNFTLSLTSGCTVGWVGPSDDLEGLGKNSPQQGFDPQTIAR
jgi:hypothetical protein